MHITQGTVEGKPRTKQWGNIINGTASTQNMRVRWVAACQGPKSEPNFKGTFLTAV